MSEVPRRRVACPTFVGRAHELALLRAAHAAAPGAVFLRGEAGVGKSRLVAEFLAGVEAAATVLTGACLPGGGLTPYVPIMAAIRGLHVGEVDAALGARPAARSPGCSPTRRTTTGCRARRTRRGCSGRC